MSANFDSSTPLAYTGLNTVRNPQTIVVNRAPTVNDWQSFYPGDLWRDTSQTPPITYILESVNSNIALWQPIGSSIGTVSSVSGTAGQIDVVPTTGNVVISMDPAYAGQTSITTLGTITFGTWDGNVIDGAHGGTGLANGGQTINLGSFAAGDVLTSDVNGNASWQPAATGAGINTINTVGPVGGNFTISGSPTVTVTPGVNSVTLSSTGAVSSVSGTANQIDVSPTTGAAVVSIDAAYAGQASITTLGTVTTGTWHGGVVAGQYGGTGVQNTGLTINLGTATSGYVLTSDVSGNATWQPAPTGVGINTINGISPLAGNFTLTAGTNITLTAGVNAITIAATKPAGVFTSVKRQVFTYTGGAQTYTPTAGMVYCDIEVVGGGGAGGGCPSTSSSQSWAAGGGGAGGYSKLLATAATIGASKTVTIGAGGAPGAAGNNPGGSGGTTSVGALLSATGGVGAAGSGTGPNGSVALGGLGGTGSGGDVNTAGQPGGNSFTLNSALLFMSGFGGSSYFGGGAISVGNPTPGNGKNAVSYGGGGSGGGINHSSAAVAGGAGYAGICIITEYVA